jgi:Lysyl oxidase
LRALRFTLRVLLLAGILGLSLGAVAAAAPPDLRQAPPPTGVGPFAMAKVGSEVQLQFPSEIDVESDGGPLTITGSRQDATVNTMDAFQSDVTGVVGALQYNYDPTHQHWHYLALDRYDLRTHDASLTEVARDQKTGFCLVQSAAVNPTDCQHNNPSALSVSETINPGFPDIYEPSRDGQYIDVTGLKGTYELVQWANADCRLTDLTPQNHTFANVVKIDAAANPPTVSVMSATPFWNQYYAGLANKCLPAETVRPSVTGPAQVGGLLSSVPGSWLDRLSNQFAYQWRRCDATGWACADIPGASAQNYVPTSADLGHVLRARVTGTFIGSTEQGTPQDSSSTAVVAPAPVASRPHVVSLTAALKTVRRVRVGTLARHGLRLRVHCSLACSVRIDLTGRGGVKLAHRITSLRKAGSRTFTLRLSRKARRIVRRFHSGALTLRLRVRSHDGQRQTVTRTLHIKR